MSQSDNFRAERARICWSLLVSGVVAKEARVKSCQLRWALITKGVVSKKRTIWTLESTEPKRDKKKRLHMDGWRYCKRDDF